MKIKNEILLKELILEKESHILELKAAKYSFDEAVKLPDYCAAISNEGGGFLLLGVADNGEIVGSVAFKGIDREHKKALILEHSRKNLKARKAEFYLTFQELKPSDISNLLHELSNENKIHFKGNPKSGYWELVRKINFSGYITTFKSTY